MQKKSIRVDNQIGEDTTTKICKDVIVYVIWNSLWKTLEWIFYDELYRIYHRWIKEDITFEFMDGLEKDYEFYGITRDPKTRNYMMKKHWNGNLMKSLFLEGDVFVKVYRAKWIDGRIDYWEVKSKIGKEIVNMKFLNYESEYAIIYVMQQNFKNWTSGNYDIDKFIWDTQLSAHDDVDIRMDTL
ncbi:kinase-like domain-containing protein [Rhizophagus clarus]|uniref:Kinase-like domain-containing protein n=1 Tax=Rhizophagus clarus TaxID=94130 RepID=A0A8H3M5Z2_9GLOM|nr:kinase-like domain-containing protein [Rhizophagus clarus]